MKEFYLPYNFIPVTGKIINKSVTREKEQRPRAKYDYDSGGERQEAAEHGSADSAKAQARHDLWQAGRHSGRIECRLCIISPTVVGNKHSGEDPTVVSQYTWRKKTAIPANSIRGMISSLAETLSQSALRVLNAGFHPAFAEIDQDLAPWNEQRVRNSGLTPAELLFGVVENNKKSDEDDGENRVKEDTRNLASRVWFSDGTLSEGHDGNVLEDKFVVLKILSSPRPKGSRGENNTKFRMDRPSLYFQASEHNPCINYDDLRKYLKKTESPHPVPHGRKFYLLRKDLKDLDGAEYKEKINGTGKQDVKNRIECTPIKPKTEFTFQVAFDNLSDAELTLLKTALEPDQDFHHRLGLGKPLGLGIVQVRIMNDIHFFNRKKRYSAAGLFAGDEEKQTDANGFVNDLGLIDTETLQRVCKAGSLKYLKPGVPVHYRDVFQQEQKEAAPLPAPDNDESILPCFYDEIQKQTVHQDISCSDTPGQNQSSGSGKDKPYVIEPGEQNTEEIQWIKKTLGAVCQKDFDQLEDEDIAKMITGKALSAQWLKINHDEDKLQVKEQIFLAVEKRELTGQWRHSKATQKALKNYNSWP